ncbi:MAG: hypothetical protein ACOX6T_21810 [Myxococcales bacterium]|jgi:hypothetical protein
MTRRSLLAAGCGLCLALSAGKAAAAEQKSPSPPPAAAVDLPPGDHPLSNLAPAVEKPAAIGDWTEFAALNKGKLDLSDTMRISILADEARPDAPWVEVWIGKTGQHALRLRSQNERPEVYLKMGAAIFSVEDPTVKPSESACQGSDCKERRKKAIRGRKRIKTLAGTFDCNHYVVNSKKGRVDLWASTQVPGFGLVRMETSWGVGLELVAFGDNAMSAFPKKFKANPLPLSAAKTAFQLMPGFAPPDSPPATAADSPPATAADSPPANAADTACDPSRATCPSAPQPAEPTTAPTAAPPSDKPQQ